MPVLVCGVDEAGRGPIAGPVTASAVILPPDFPTDILDDSKKLSPEKRKACAAVIKEKAVAWAVGWAWPEEIDRLNIHHATLLCMKRAIDALAVTPDIVLVDGKFTPSVAVFCKAYVKGDTFLPPVQAASIIAKTTRDAWMERYALIKPEYLFDIHKGYPTKKHRELVRQYGLTPIHRQSFTITFP